MSQKNNRPVPFVDLVAPHVELEDELVTVFRHALKAAGFIGGPAVEKFEGEFASYCGTKYCVGVGSGTDAIRFALMAAGVRPGEAVITVPNTFIATAEAITQAGALPVFVDIDEKTFNMDAEKLRAFLEDKCRFDISARRPICRRCLRPISAILPVHLYGQPADMDAIRDMGERYGLSVVEDSCQAHGADYYSYKESKWTRAGSMGVSAAFSFYPGKNLGACGEGGAVTTDSIEIADTVRVLRDHGQRTKYHHEIEGYNGRLDAIQAGILSVKMNKLEAWNDSRRARAARYDDMLGGIKEIMLPHASSRTRHVYHLYVVRAQRRDELQKMLASEGISTGLHYPIPLHIQKAYKRLGHKEGDFPVAEKVSGEILSLPMYPDLSESQQEAITSAIAAFYGCEG